MNPFLCRAAVAALAICLPVAAPAAVVGFVGTVANTCVLSVTTPGVLAASAAGTQLSSEEGGGVEAVMTVVSTGSAPTLTFGAPTLTGPPVSTTAATKEIGFSSAAGASQGFVSTLVNTLLGRFSDTFTIKGRVTNANGFVSGAYTLSTVVTCQQ